jgi:integrase
MSNVTVKLLLRESKQRSDGTAPVYLRVTAHRKSRYKSTGIRIQPKHWNKGRQRVRKSHELHAAYNDKLRAIRIEAEQAALQADTAEAVKAQLEGKSGSLTSYFELFIESKRRKDEFWQRKKYQTTLNKLQAALGRDAIDWRDFARETLERFEQYCRDERKNAVNTVRKELQRLRTFTRQAVKDGVIDGGDDPFHAYDLPQRQPPDRRRLTLQEIRKLEAADLPEGSDRAMARDAFLLSFYGGGIRFGDLCRLRPEHVEGGRLRYRMMKTGNPVDLPLPPQARKIVERWAGGHDRPFIFPMLEEGDTKDPVELRRRIASHLTRFNQRIKEVAGEAEIENPDEVTSHVARHSFADHARRRSSDLYAVSKALGHSSLEQTQSYLNDFDREATDQLANEMWGGEGNE